MIKRLIRLPVFCLILVFEHPHIGIISALGNIMLLYGLNYGTSRLMRMGAVAEAAVFGHLEYFREISAYLTWLHVEGAKPLYSGRVDSPSPLRHFQHFAERGGVHPGIMRL